MTRKTTILIAEDHSMVRQGFRKILESGFDCHILEASSHAEVISSTRENMVDVVLLDINMPDGSAAQTLRALKQEHPDIRVLVVSMFEEEQFAVRMIRAGADGYISKSASPDEYLNAVRKIISGRRYISGIVAELLADLAQDKKQELSMQQLLSVREYEVFCLIAMGKSVSDVALQLSLSIKTISTYRSKILEKTGLKSNAEIMLYALQNNIIPV